MGASVVVGRLRHVEAFFWLGRTGVAWRDLPPHPGYWHRVYVRFARWRDAGVWERVAHWLSAHKRRILRPASGRYSSIRPVSASISTRRARLKKGEQAIGRSRGERPTKWHLSCDGAGNVLNWTLMAGQAGDCPQAGYLLAPHLGPACEVVADAAYDSAGLRGWIAAEGALAVILPNLRRKYLPHFDPCAYAKRYHIEQTFTKLKQHRRLAARYDKSAASFQAFVCARILALYIH